jgi:Domain of Unknown Function (DUF928)
MFQSKVFLALGLVSAIGATEILGLTNFVMPTSSNVAQARPFRRTGGGKRGICQTSPKQAQTPLMAFLPEAGQAADASATNAPTLYFYVPEQSEQVANLEFRLDYADRAKRGNGVINPPMSVPITNTPGVVKVQLPPVLVKDVTYTWSLTLRCQGSRDTVSFKGLVVYKDLDPAVAAQVQQATSAKAKAQIYTAAGFMIDAVPLLMADGQLQAKTFATMIEEVGLTMPIEASDAP